MEMEIEIEMEKKKKKMMMIKKKKDCKIRTECIWRTPHSKKISVCSVQTHPGRFFFYYLDCFLGL